MVLYVIAAYIKLHFNNDKKGWQYFIVYLICGILTYLSSIHYGYSWGYNFLTNLIGSVMLFLCFSKMNIKSRIINYIASFVFGIYMSHCDFQTENLIYNSILKCNMYVGSKYLIIHMFLSMAILFVVCLILDIVRSKIFKCIINPIIDSIKILKKEIG